MYKILLRLLFPYRVRLIFVAVLILISILASLALPWMIKIVIDNIKDTSQLHLLLLSGVIIFLSGSVSLYWSRYNVAKIAQDIIYDLRTNVYHHLLNLPIEYFNKQKTGDIIARVMGDISIIDDALLTRIILIIPDFMIMIAILMILLSINTAMTLLAFIALPLISITVSRQGNIFRKISQKIQEGLGQMSATLQESLLGIKDIRA
ncbi:MAG: ABC transporter ATP-binding protein, partial [candidate division Zixibacteria bacterium]|nr:ABC transporter ATP-binding protein [candidate division Zixibacteria bacterium]